MHVKYFFHYFRQNFNIFFDLFMSLIIKCKWLLVTPIWGKGKEIFSKFLGYDEIALEFSLKLG